MAKTVSLVEYQRLMDARIRYAMQQRVKMGCVPFEDELDRLYPIPKQFIADLDEPASWMGSVRTATRERSYGVCGITPHRKRWLARIDRRGRKFSKYFQTAVEAARWYNEVETKKQVHPLLCSIAAAEMLDTQELRWSEVMNCRRAGTQPSWDILRKIEEREKWHARSITG